ncbi:MAG: PAS domain S-box protein, partial [Candidatus Neomarinimicrobiota bacterium]
MSEKEKEVSKLTRELEDLRSSILLLKEEEKKHFIDIALNSLSIDQNLDFQSQRDILESMSDGIVVLDRKYRYTYVNMAAQRLLKISTEEIVGKNITPWELFPQYRHVGVARSMQEAMAGKRATSENVPYNMVDGTIEFTTENYFPLFTDKGEVKGVVGIIMDNTERKLAASALSNLSEELIKERDLFISGPVIVVKWPVRADQPLEYISPNVQEVLGYSFGELMAGEVVYKQIIHSQDRKRVLEEARNAINSDLTHFRHDPYRLVAKDGRFVWVTDYTTIIKDPKGKLQGFIGYIIDITDLKRAENVITALYDISKAVNVAESQAALLERIHKAMGTIIDAKNFYIALYDKERDRITFPYYRDEKDDYFPSIEQASRSDSVTAWLIKQGKAAILKRKDLDRLVKDADSKLVGSLPEVWLGTPLIINGEIIGTIVVQSYSDEQHYHQDDLQLLESISGQIAFALERTEAKKTIERLATFPQKNPSPVVELDIDGEITYVNPAGEQLLKAKELSIEDIYKILPPDCKTVIKNSLSDDMVIVPSEVQVDGQTLLWSGHALPDLQRVQFYATDITELKKTEMKLIEAKDQAQKSEQVKSLFLANMSHEIRTPLNSILGFSELVEAELKDSIGSDEQFFFGTIRRSGKRLMRTVDEILDISQIEADTFKLKKTPLELLEIIQSIVVEFTPRAKKKNLKLNFKSSIKGAYVFMDEHSIEKAITNLVDNAIKYTNSGNINIQLEREENIFVLTVQDSGIGMSPKYQDELFGVFSQESTGYTKKYQGVGLGLALVKRYLDLNDVSIQVSSRKNAGTIFTLKFPEYTEIVISEVRRSGVSSQKDGISAASTHKNWGILVVEDDKDSQQLINFYLRNEYNIWFATSVANAKSLIEEHPIGLILLDLSLEGDEDGLNLVRQLRNEEKWRGMPVIALTA